MTDEQIVLKHTDKYGYMDMDGILSALADARADERAKEVIAAARREQHAECVRLLLEKAREYWKDSMYEVPGNHFHNAAEWLESQKP